MKTSINGIIARKPHLADPLRFYEKTIRFINDVRNLGLPCRPDGHAYPPEHAAAIMDRFAAALDLSAGNLSPLRQALEVGDLDFTRLPLGESPAFSLPYSEDDLTILLFILSRPFFLGLRDKVRIHDRPWDGGTCPFCKGRPSLASRDRDDLRLHCSFCGSAGHFPRSQCPLCLSTEQNKLRLLTFAGEEQLSIQACEACKGYIKIVKTLDRTASFACDLADLESMPLDIVIQQKGYRRRSPNPVGMVRMAVSG